MTDRDRLLELFHQATVLPPAERPRFLDAACAGDAALRSEVEALLRADAAAGGTARLGRPVAGLADAAVAADTPEWIGPYRVLERLGEGGMGVVYRAEQHEPVRREVAVKLVRAGLGSASGVARFEVERQALAAMDHPGIARLFDAGTSDDGRPYFAMELVRGRPITEYCRLQGLDLRERARLFLDVALAVRHAHRRGVIHRDLKPSNILITEVGGKPVPKVIDFSIAKALSEPGLATEFRTRTGQLVGTLEYMSPEQATGRLDRIDMRSDVYGLGVVLYELVADRLPHDVAGLPLHEAVRRISEEPPRSLRGSVTTVTGRLDADLETIITKCLETEPDRRYESAADVADDLERFLESRPILARPPSRAYQLRKLIRRHRIAFSIVALCFAFLVVFSATLAVQLGIQRRERARAETQARKSERITEFLQEAFQAAVDEYGYQASVKQSLDLAAQRLATGATETPEAEVAIRTAIAQGYLPFAEHARMEQLLGEALELGERGLGPDHPEVVSARFLLAESYFYSGHPEESEREAQQVVAALERQQPPDEEALAQMHGLIGLLRLKRGDLETAEAELERQRDYYAQVRPSTKASAEGLALARENLANVYHRQGRLDESIQMMRDVLEMRREAGVGLGWGPNNLGILLNQQGRYDEAEPLFREGIAYVSEESGPRHPMLGQWLLGLGNSLRGQGRLDAAEAAYRAGQEIVRDANGEDDPLYRRLTRSLGELSTARERERLGTPSD